MTIFRTTFLIWDHLCIFYKHTEHVDFSPSKKLIVTSDLYTGVGVEVIPHTGYTYSQNCYPVKCRYIGIIVQYMAVHGVYRNSLPHILILSYFLQGIGNADLSCANRVLSKQY